MTDKTQALRDLLAKVEAGEAGWNRLATIAEDALPPREAALAATAYRGSLDAAKALHDAVLPDFHWSLYDDNGIGIYEVQIEVKDWQGEPISGASKVNPSRAWLIAILRALIAQAEQ